MPTYRRLLLGAALAIVPLLALYAHAMHYYPFLSDDSLISLRYVARLLDGKGLTWTDGQPVEGYSNLLWILFIAFLGRVGVDPIDASRVLGFLGMGTVVMTILCWHARGKGLRQACLPVAAGAFFFCMAAPVAVWALGGLEQPLYAALIALSIPFTIQVTDDETPRGGTLAMLSSALALLCLTRPDGPLFSVAAFLAISIGRYCRGKSVLSLGELSRLGSLPALAYFGQLFFRLSYYGEFVPNTALVKIAPSGHHLMHGVDYVAGGLWALFPFSLLAVLSILAAIRSPHSRSAGIPLLAILALWVPYVVFIGGDIFPAYRHFTPIVVVFAFALAEGADWVRRRLRLPLPLKHKAILSAGAIVACTWFAILQFTLPANREAISERWEWDGKAMGLLLKRAFSEQQPLIAVSAAGCLPYWSELPAVDMLGLNDHYLPRHPPDDFGKGNLGHELGDAAYVLQRRPDLVIFHTGDWNASFRSGRDLQRAAAFQRRFTPVRVLATHPHRYTATLWVDKDSPRIGIRRSPSEIRVPGFLLNGQRDTVAYANEAGRLVVPVHSTQSASVALDSMADRHWSVTIKASGAEDVRYELQHGDASLIVTLFSKRHDPIEIEEIILTRTNAS